MSEDHHFCPNFSAEIFKKIKASVPAQSHSKRLILLSIRDKCSFLGLFIFAARLR
jgi:hypothetical protein